MMEVFVGLVLVFGTLFAAVTFYSYKGGAGGIAASARRRQPLPSPEPLAAPVSQFPSLAAAPPATAGRGFSRPEALAEIDAYFANDLNVATVALRDLVPDVVTRPSLRRQATLVAEKIAHLKKTLGQDDAILKEFGDIQERFLESKVEQAFEAVRFQRTLRDMADEERATLRVAEMLCILGEMTPREKAQVSVPIVWNQGRSLMTGADAFTSADRLDAFREGVSVLFRGHLGEARTAIERVQEVLRRALLPGSKVTSTDKSVLERYLFAGARWRVPDQGDILRDGNPPKRASALRLGTLEGSEREVFYDRNESLITIGPPGTGKSQTLMRNLLTIQGGALVVDIKGELYEATAEWRRRHVGDVYRFAPADLANSIQFNPLDAVRATPEDAYEDADKLTNLLIVPEDAKGKDFWDKSGLDLLRNTILDVALHEGHTEDTRHRRSLASVFDRLSLDPGAMEVGLQEGSEMEEWTRKLAAAGRGDYGAPVSILADQAKSLRTMASKMRSSIIKTAQIHMGTWRAPRFERLTQRSTFDPLSLRGERPATVYICVTAEEMHAYATVLRAFIGQTFYALCRGKADPSEAVTFFVDEMPKLGRLDILETALDLGRGHGVRTWSFAQYYDQIEKTFHNGEGFLKSCFIRMWMGIDPTTAQRLSRELGERMGILDGKRKALVEPHELAGAAFRDLILATLRNDEPMRLKKRLAYEDPEIAARMLPVGEIDAPGYLRYRPETA